MLKVEGLYGGGATRIGKCNINLSNEVTGEARVNLPLELSLPADPFKWTKRQTQNWLCWLREANDIEQLDITQFNVDGIGLCNLSPQLIEDMVGIRAGNIFRSTLDLLQSTAALVRNSPPSSQATYSPPVARHSPPVQMTRPSPPAEISLPPLTISPLTPQHISVRSALLINSPEPRTQLHYQTPGEMPTYNRSSVITSEDIARLQPVAPEEQTFEQDTALSAAKIERRRFSDSSVEGEEDTLNRKYFPISKTERRPSSNGIDCGRQGVTLWQFILELLADEDCSHIVTWTENLLEFKVINSKEMAIRWGARKNRPKMNYDKLSRALRYYYRKNLIQHVPGKRQVYFFVEHPESLDFTQLLNNAMVTHPAKTRKSSAFTHVQGAKRTNNEFANAFKKSRTVEPLSMLGYHGMPQLLALQSPLIGPPFSKHFYQLGNMDLTKHIECGSLPSLLSTGQRIERLFTQHQPQTILPQPNPLVMSSPPNTDSELHKISVLDTGSIKQIY